ncbi:MAG: hypothetical protein ACTSQJ_02710 [Promethearchaeota archaeon]
MNIFLNNRLFIFSNEYQNKKLVNNSIDYELYDVEMIESEEEIYNKIKNDGKKDAFLGIDVGN